MNLTEQLTGILNDIQGVWTETSLIVGSILILLFGLVRSSEVIVKSLFLMVVFLALWLNSNNQLVGGLLMNGIFIADSAIYFGGLFLVVAALVLVFPRGRKHSTEFYFFILAMLAGNMFMMKANSLLIIYLSIELVSFSSYILTNFSFKKSGFEAGIKYLLFGAISSAVMLFGLGLMYGSTGTFTISDFSVLQNAELITQLGTVMMLLGIFFKISIVPSHIWVPATYQSAPADATAFMSIVPKIAALVLLQRVVSIDWIESSPWIFETVFVLGILSIVIGTLGAFNQTNARRMVSFGAIAHSGFLLPFALIDSDTSAEAFWWYATVYALMNLAVFYLIDQYERRGVHRLEEYSKTASDPWTGGSFTLVLMSLVGLPPLAGFMAKFFLFSTLWESYVVANNTTLLWYLVVAVLATVGSLFYYLQIPKHIFLSKGQQDQSINFNLLTKIIATLFTIGLLLLFFAPKLVIVMQQLLNNVHE